MQTFNFSLIITTPSVDEETATDKLFEAGCDDGTFSVSGGVYEVEFDRDARSLREALHSAIGQVNKAGIGSRVVRAVPDDLVNAKTIAKRSGKSRQAVSLWIAGERGQGFPSPRAMVGDSPVWSWAAVAGWLHDRGDLAKEAVDAANVLADINREIDAASEERPKKANGKQRKA